MNVSRRHLFAGAAALPLLLGACSSITASQAQQDVQSLADGLSGIVGALTNLPGNLAPSADLAAKIQAEIDAIKADAAAIGTAITPSASTVQTLEAAVTALVPLVTPFFPAAPAVAAVVQAALAILPVILAQFGVTSLRKAAAAPAMSVDQARLILRAAAESGLK